MSAETATRQQTDASADENVGRLQRALAAVTRLLGQRATLGTIATRCGINLPQASWALLEYLNARGAMRVSDIAACYGVDVSSVTPRLKALEEIGMVARKRAPGDGRVSIIEISDNGRLALASVCAAQRDIIVEALADSDISSQEVLGAVVLLEYLAGRLDAVVGERNTTD